MVTDHIQTQETDKCLLCNKEGVTLYANIPDRIQNVSGLWGFKKCFNCGLIWLNPCPIAEDIGKTYKAYFTHDADGSKSRLEIFQEKIALPILSSAYWHGKKTKDKRQKTKDKRTSYHIFLSGWLLSLIPLFNNMARRYVMNLLGDHKGRLLDIGCGNGRFLADMKKLGWEVVGVEPDPDAAKIAKERFGISVFTGVLDEANFPSNSIDAITMRHVIEHIEDPKGLICECYRILKPDGKLTILTPNTGSLQHRLFKPAWLELDPPRHLHLFSLDTLVKLIESVIPRGFRIEDLRSISVNSGQVYIGSRSIKREGTCGMRELSLRQMVEGLVFWVVEEVVRLFSLKSGEEILMTVIKHSEYKGNELHS